MLNARWLATIAGRPVNRFSVPDLRPHNSPACHATGHDTRAVSWSFPTTKVTPGWNEAGRRFATHCWNHCCGYHSAETQISSLALGNHLLRLVVILLVTCLSHGNRRSTAWWKMDHSSAMINATCEEARKISCPMNHFENWNVAPLDHVLLCLQFAWIKGSPARRTRWVFWFLGPVAK